VNERTDWRASRAKRWQAAAIGAAGYPIVAALGRTLRWRVEGLAHLEEVARAGRQPIMAFWHGRILPATYYFRQRGIWVISSENFDGEWMGRIIKKFGYRKAPGSTSRGGTRALVMVKRAVEQGAPAGFTLDGPRGPALQAKRGAVWLASSTRNPVVPFHIEAARCWTLRSWDRTQIPKPFSTVGIAVGAPLYYPGEMSEDDIDAACRSLERVLECLRDSALALVRGRD
jgi:lysophospholipid acyltransferase (LPLAT)-like uncharacterized protein